MLHVSVIYEHHQAFTNTKLYWMFATGLRVTMDGGVVYKFLHKITIFKYLSKLIKTYFKIIIF
jgi:hypothetical protein